MLGIVVRVKEGHEIKEGDFLSLDYGYEVEQEEEKYIPCYCNSNNCTGLLFAPKSQIKSKYKLTQIMNCGTPNIDWYNEFTVGSTIISGDYVLIEKRDGSEHHYLYRTIGAYHNRATNRVYFAGVCIFFNLIDC